MAPAVKKMIVWGIFGMSSFFFGRFSARVKPLIPDNVGYHPDPPQELQQLEKTTSSSGFDLTSIFEHLDDSRLNPWLAKRCKSNDPFCRNEYSQNKPFPHINFDDFWPSELAKAVDNETDKWVQMSYGLESGRPCPIPESCYYSPPYSQKLGIMDEHRMGVATRLLFSMLKSSNMVCVSVCVYVCCACNMNLLDRFIFSKN